MGFKCDLSHLSQKITRCFLTILESAHWQALWQLLAHAKLDRRYTFAAAQQEKTEGSLAVLLAETFATKMTEEWLALLDKAGVPCAPILPLPQLFSDDHIAANDLLATHTHPQWGAVRQTGILAKFSRTPATLPYVAPLLGQHTAAVLQEVTGYGQEKIAQLVKAGAIKA